MPRRDGVLSGLYQTEEEAWLFQALEHGAHPEQLERSVLQIMRVTAFPNDITRCRLILSHIRRLREAGAFNGIATLAQLEISLERQARWETHMRERFGGMNMLNMMGRNVGFEAGKFSMLISVWFRLVY